MYVFNAVSRFHQATGEETMVRQRWRGVRRRVVVVEWQRVDGQTLARGEVKRYSYGSAIFIPRQSKVRVLKERERLAVWACHRTLAHAFVDGIDQLIRFAGAKVTAPGQTCSQVGTTGQADGKVWKSTSGHRESGEDAIGCSHGVSEGRTDFTCIDCVAPLACRLAT